MWIKHAVPVLFGDNRRNQKSIFVKSQTINCYFGYSFWVEDQSLPVNNMIVVSTPHFETVTVSWGNVSYHMNLFTTELCTLKFIDEPLKFFCWISAVQQQPPVYSVLPINEPWMPWHVFWSNSACIQLCQLLNLHNFQCILIWKWDKVHEFLNILSVTVTDSQACHIELHVLTKPVIIRLQFCKMHPSHCTCLIQTFNDLGAF
jgi:hypothetical protein